MAKKKKQKKAGLEKRRKSKLNRKVAQKRKLIAKKPVQQKISPSKVKQNLKNIPSLIFEPELQEISFSKEQIIEARESHEKLPDQVEAVGTPDFLEKLKEQHEAMKVRFEEERDANKSMMVQAILYFLEQENAPAFLNQVVVAMYINGLHLIDNDEPLTLKELNQRLREYDKDWAEYLQEKMDVLSPVDEPQVDTPDELTPEEEQLIAPSAFEDVFGEFSQYLESEKSLDEEMKERMEEDVEVFVTDYLEEKGVTSFEDIQPRRIKSFLEGWFIRTMNPTKGDLESMIASLETFLTFIGEKTKVTAEKSKELLDVLEDKEAFLSKLEV